MQDCPPFSELGLPPDLTRGIEDLGFEAPSPIQVGAIPPALEGLDVVGLSETGSGKTAAFALPALAKIDPALDETQVLVLCPTRELAVQVCEETHRLGKFLDGLRTAPVYGGAPIHRQIQQLRRGAHVVVGTPGRLLDHLRRGSFDPSHIRMTILDEADRMLDMGFQDEMEELLAALPNERQTLFFSATMGKRVARLIENFGNNPQTVEIERKQLTVESIEQVSYEVRNRSKIEVISRLLDMEQPRLAIVFCNTKRAVDECTEALMARGYSADRLHGDITQHMRERVLRRFRDGTVDLLVATDVAARGLDVDEIDVVINYDLPQDPEDYVHRVGRTGRAGRAGRAISFVFGRDIHRLKTIERFTNQRIPRAKIPTQEDVEGKMSDQLFETLRERLEADEFDDYSAFFESLKSSGHTETDIANVAFTLLRDTFGREGEDIIEDRGKPDRGERHRERPKNRDREERSEVRPDPIEEFDDEQSKKKKRKKPHPDKGGMVTLFINLGKAHKVRPKDIAGMLYNQAALPQGTVGRIFQAHKHSKVEVSSEFAEQAIDSARTTTLCGKRFKIDYDRG
ncbi:MAG: DEAD/DEAH box helicase [Verrucomicrobiales bacterium]|nr:DEAD/DEAH box helicase [Verrucomicrobiales bacterium]